MTHNTVAVILLASGVGSRTQLPTPKQFLKLSNITLFEECLNTFYNNPKINYILPVINLQHLTIIEPILSSYAPHSKILPYCEGGIERKDSVLAGLLALQQVKPTKVLIHDSSRPFISNGIINEIINTIAPQVGAVPALKITDSVKLVNDNFITKNVERDKLYSVQTPQGFLYEEILKGYESRASYPDDSSYFLENSQNQVKIIAGDLKNSKITYAPDLEYLKKLTGTLETRIGQGIDIHEFANNTPLYLGGLHIPHSKGLKGHSDADVVLHALFDALMGTCGGGDIGDHFPPSNMQWHQAPSKIFIDKAKELLIAAGGTIINLDITIMAEEPKITPHKKAMSENIAKLLNISASKVNIKATTAEKLGFVGRGERIYACCVASVAYCVSA